MGFRCSADTNRDDDFWLDPVMGLHPKAGEKSRSYPPWLVVQIVSITSFLFIIPIYLILINNLSIITIFLVAGLMFLLLMIIKQSIQMLKLHYFHWRRNEKQDTTF